MRSPHQKHGRRSYRASVERMESRQLLATFAVTNTADSGLGSLREAIGFSNARPGADNIVFDIPASLSANLDVPVPGFNPVTQTWRITLNSPLPALTDTVTIDGLSQAHGPVPYRYPQQSQPEPTVILSSGSTLAAKAGYDAALRLIVDGSQTGGGVGFDVRASNSNVRGLVIDGFGVGVAVTNPNAEGVRVQGNAIGGYFFYPVNGNTGEVLSGPGAVGFDGLGNAREGIRVLSSNTTIGGMLPQETNLIVGNGRELNPLSNNEGYPGISILPGAVGNLISGNQIGIAGPSTNGLFLVNGNGAEGIRINASSSNTVADNLISGNGAIGGTGANSMRVRSGIHILGPASTRNNITGNYVGTGPGGGFLFGSPDTGNQGDGVLIENAADNRVGGLADTDRNVIGANEGAGIRIIGAGAAGNRLIGNYIGTTAAGNAALGNSLEGVFVSSPHTLIGPGNLISANLRGVLLSSADAHDILITNNKIGTDASGFFDLGNALEGVRIEGASGNVILGDGAGSQVISGNNVGVLILGGTAPGNLVQGNFIGTTVLGTSDLGNSLEGVRVEDASGNTIGGTMASARNLISANHWGVTLTGGFTFNNLVQGNYIGSDLTGSQPIGTRPLGNELDGVLVTQAAYRNTIGGSPAAGNLIAFNRREGVRVENLSVGNTTSNNQIIQNGRDGVHIENQSNDNAVLSNQISQNGRDGVRVENLSLRNAILNNRILQNGGLGIQLISGGNQEMPSPVLSSVDPGVTSTIIKGTLNSTPNATFRIQFFAVMPPDESGFGEGDVYLGETFVATDSAGNASFVATVPVVVTAGQLVTATATDPSGNTSEFSGTRPIEPTTIQFAMAGYTVNEADGMATITVNRSGGSGSAVSVNYATADGSAVAGSDYVSTSGTLTFAPGKTCATFKIPILLNLAPEGLETVILKLSNATNGATLGVPASAVLTIVDDTTDRTGPQVVGVRAIGGPLGVASIVVSFNEPMDPARAVNLVNYGYSVRIAGRDGRLGTRDDLLIGVASATYDPVLQSVTLLLAKPILKKTAMRLMINQATDIPGAGTGVSDVGGNLLDGNADGQPGGPFVTKVVAQPVPRRPRMVKRRLSAH